MKKETNKKVQYSKILPIITGIIFICCLYKGLTMELVNYTDLTVVATSITVSGGIFGSTIIWYMKKSQVENNVKLKTELFRVASQEKIKYNEQMMLLKNKYMLTDDELFALENDSPMNHYANSALSSIEESIDMALSDAETPVDIQVY